MYANGEKGRDDDQGVREQGRRFEEISPSLDFEDFTLDEGDGTYRKCSDADNNVDTNPRPDSSSSSSSDIDPLCRQSRVDRSEGVGSRGAQGEWPEERKGNGVGGSRRAGEHYYMKLSSTVEHPHPFIERSLPFFNPPVSPL